MLNNVTSDQAFTFLRVECHAHTLFLVMAGSDLSRYISARDRACLALPSILYCFFLGVYFLKPNKILDTFARPRPRFRPCPRLCPW